MTKEEYHSKRWQRIRKRVLARDGYQCQVSKRFGKTESADTVHHIFPADKWPEYKWQEWNLISVNKDVHNLLHDRSTGQLSDLGDTIMRELATKRGIVVEGIVLVVGMPASGKTTYVQQHLRNGLAYDLDHIAAAFRLKPVKKESHDMARKMANSLMVGWCQNVSRFADTAYVIRTAPSVDEVIRISPCKIVFCMDDYGTKKKIIEYGMDEEKTRRRLQDLIAWTKIHHFPHEFIQNQSPPDKNF